MKRKDIIIIFIVGLIVLIPIIMNELKNKEARDLKTEVSEVLEIVSGFNKNLSKTVKYSIDNELVIDGNKYKVNATGVVFADSKDIVILLSRNGYCAAKTLLTDEIVVSKGDCPDYDLIKGIKSKISTSGDGLYKVNNDYFYKGTDVDNYILFNDELWRIISINSLGEIKIISNDSLLFTKWSNYNNIYNSLNNIYNTFSTKIKNNIVISSYNIGGFDLVSNFQLEDLLKSEENEKKSSNIGMISISDYISSCGSSYKIGNDTLICGNSFINDAMWVGAFENKKYYLYKDNNIYADVNDIERGINPVVVLNKKIEIISGTGTSLDPYKYE